MQAAASAPGAQAAAPTATARAVSRGKTSQEIALEKEVQSLDQVTRNIVVKNTIEGAIAGAVGGCVLARLSGRDCRDGLIAGGIAGGIAGNQIGQRAAQAETEIVKATETLQQLQKVSAQLVSIESNLQAVLRSQNSEIASLRRQLAAGQVTKASVDGRISAINNNRQTVIAGLAKGEQNLANQQNELVTIEQESGENLAQPRQAVASTRSRITSLRNAVQVVSN